MEDPQPELAIRSVEEEEEEGALLEAWEALEQNCNETKNDLRNIRNIAAADLHDSGERLLIATYGGIFEYSMSPFDL